MKKTKFKILLTLLLAFTMIIVIPGTSALASDVDTDDDSVDSSTVETPVAETPAPTPEDTAKQEKEARNAAIEARNAELKKEIASLESSISKVQEEQKAIKNNIANVQEELGEATAKVTYIDGQISNTQYEISLLESSISLLEEEISLKEEAISFKQHEYNKNYSIFTDRLKAMYMYDSSSTLGLILGVDDFAKFLTTTDNISYIADHDEKMLAALNVERLALEDEMADLEVSKKETDSVKTVTESKKVELAEQKNVAQEYVQEVSDLKSQFESDFAASKAKSDAMKAEMESAMSQIVLIEEEYAGGTMAWPTPGFTKISSSYGPRFNGSDYHTGVDLTGGGIHGANVVAANDGVVALVNWSYAPGRGYGIYVVVDHGGGITTLYAHLSNIYVSQGQRVGRGEAVGAVGSTGWSTGPHLHFEVRVNKQHTDPLPYIR